MEVYLSLLHFKHALWCLAFVIAIVADHKELLEHHLLEYHPTLHNHFLSSHAAGIDLYRTLSN